MTTSWRHPHDLVALVGRRWRGGSLARFAVELVERRAEFAAEPDAEHQADAEHADAEHADAEAEHADADAEHADDTEHAPASPLVVDPRLRL